MAFDDPFNSDNVRVDDDGSNNFNDEDPAAEFLARERRELGDITGQDDTNSLDDPFRAPSHTTDRNSLQTNGKCVESLVGLENDVRRSGAHSPMLNTGGSNSPNPTSNGSQYQALSQLNEPETIRKWREEFAERITKKDAEEELKRQEMREQAKKELDEFHKQRAEQMDRACGQNRASNRAFEDDLLNNGSSSSKASNGKVHDWDKITSLCEFNPKNNRSQKDLTRYRSVLLQLKQQQQQTDGK